MNDFIFTLGGWVALSVSLGAKRESLQRHTAYRAVFFDSPADRDTFLDLCLEQLKQYQTAWNALSPELQEEIYKFGEPSTIAMWGYD